MLSTATSPTPHLAQSWEMWVLIWRWLTIIPPALEALQIRFGPELCQSGGPIVLVGVGRWEQVYKGILGWVLQDTLAQRCSFGYERLRRLVNPVVCLSWTTDPTCLGPGWNWTNVPCFVWLGGYSTAHSVTACQNADGVGASTVMEDTLTNLWTCLKCSFGLRVFEPRQQLVRTRSSVAEKRLYSVPRQQLVRTRLSI